MSFPITNFAALPVPKSPMNSLLSRALDSYMRGTQAAFGPQQFQADIQQKQAASQKNLIMSKLLESVMKGNEGGVGNAFSSGGNGMQGNLNPAIIKAFTGIDPYLMSPQQAQDLKIKGQLETQGNKSNLTTGSSDVARELLQDKVSMPQEYMGILGSGTMAKDLLAAKLGDTDAKERLIQAAVAEKLVPEYSGFQLMSQGQKATVTALKHQQEAIRQGWPMASRKITNNLPAELQKEAEKRHNEIVKNVNRTREAFYNSGGKVRPGFNHNSTSNETNQHKEDFFQPKSLEEKIKFDKEAMRDAQATANALNSKGIKATPELILEAQSQGVKTFKEFKDFLERRNQNE